MMNGTKTFFFMTLMTVLLVVVGAAFDKFFRTGGQFVGLFFMISLVMNLFSYWFADTVILAMHGAREVSPAETPRLHAVIDRLVDRSGLPKPKVCVVPSQIPNAFATGRNPRHAAVAVTEGLLQILNEDELEGVISHEMAHIKHYDTLLQTIVASMAGLVALIASQARWGLLLGGGRDRENNNPLAVVGILFVAILAPIFATIVRMLISQQREYAADAGGAQISGNPIALATALRTIDKQAHRLMGSSFGRGEALGFSATEHLYFINHFSLGERAFQLFSSHPPTEKRIARLLAMAESGRF
ncbi:zinc metalloprotease HtpX [Candidatus Sumerlaeota bacterium]|nr:zinc metalloprotease HtpX [Candidatus Sumerlaeota bacterium]